MIRIIFYKQNSLFKGTDHRIAQQIDIMPSLLLYLGYDQPFFAFGNNLLDSAGTRFSVNFMNDVYQLTEDGYLLQFDGQQTIGLFHIPSDSLLQTNLAGQEEKTQKKMEAKLKAIIQTYTSGMVHNRLTARNASLKKIK